MPAKNYNEYMNNYMKNRYHDRRKYAVESLGGKCASCGGEEDLQFDHVDPNEKEFNLARKLHTVSKERFEREVDKCQLLCAPCHREKTRLGEEWSKGRWGDFQCDCGIKFTDRQSYAGHSAWCDKDG